MYEVTIKRFNYDPIKSKCALTYISDGFFYLVFSDKPLDVYAINISEIQNFKVQEVFN